MSAVDDESSQLGKGFTGGKSEGLFGNKKLSLKSWTRKKTATLAVTAVIGGGGIFGFSILQGPFQLVHLSQILQSNMRSGENDTDMRVRGIYKWIRTGDAGHTRIGRVGEFIIKKQTAKWAKMGIDVETGPRFGTSQKIKMDLSKSENPFHKYNGLSKATVADRLAKEFPGLDAKDIKVDFSNGRNASVSIDVSKLKNPTADLHKLTSPDTSKIVAYGQKRVLKKFFGERLFHKFMRSNDAKATATAEANAAQENQDERKKNIHKAAEQARQKENRQETRGKVMELKGKIGDMAGKKGVKLAGAGAMGGVSMLCLVKDLSEIVPEYNKAFRDDSVNAAMDMISLGSQVQSGDDLSMSQVGGVVQNFEGKDGKSIWSAKALQATSGKTKPTGEDFDDSMKQAYSGDSKWYTVNEYVEKAIPAENFTCSGPVQLALTAGEIGLVVAASAATGGAAGVAWQAAKGAAWAVGGAVVMNLAIKTITPDFQPPEVISGALGGNFIAYGAREAANVSARAQGGTELSNSESAMVDKQIVENSQKEFSQKSFFARMFDVNDYRSLASMSIDQINVRPQSMLSYLGSSLNFSNLISGISSTVSSKASAANNDYSWGFNRYGLKQSVLNDSKYEDPIGNAEKALAAIKADPGLADRMKKCFGVELNEEQDGFTATEMPDQNDKDYADAKCADNNETWNRISLAIFDDSVVTSLACYEADDSNPEDAEGTEACQEINGGQQPQQATATEVVGEKIDIANIRKDSDKISCASGTKDLGVKDGYTQGKKVKIRICEIPNNLLPSDGEESKNGYGISGASGGAIVNSRISGATLAMAKAMQEAKLPIVRACSSFRTMEHQRSLYASIGPPMSARPGYSNHQLGVALDLYADKDKCGSSSLGTSRPNSKPHKTWDWLKSNADNYGFKQLSFEFWHWSPLEQ